MLGTAFHSALSGMAAAEFALGVTANNLANAFTDGFKASRVSFVEQGVTTLSPGSASDTSHGGRNPVQIGRGVQPQLDANFSQGALFVTGDSGDLALEGEGFFVVEGPQGERLFTRDGRFGLNGNGEFVSSGGYRVLGVGGDPIRATNDLDVTVSEDGSVVGTAPDGSRSILGQLSVVRFSNAAGLVRRGHNLFAVGANSGLPTAATARVMSGAREASNTSIANEIVNLSRYSTMFRANLLVLETGNEMLESLLNLQRR